MARMLSRMHPSFCPVCRRGPAGRDCPDSAVDKKTQRAREKREWRQEAAAACMKVPPGTTPGALLGRTHQSVPPLQP